MAANNNVAQWVSEPTVRSMNHSWLESSIGLRVDASLLILAVFISIIRQCSATILAASVFFYFLSLELQSL